MAFPQSFLDELVARSDIVDVVGSYVALTKKGANYFGLCPFHNEKTGSFSVSPDKQIYHCFGCKKGGGVISFIMEEENLSFPDAVRFLAKRANLPVPEEEQGESSRLRARLLELNRDAARFYYELLHDKRGEACAEYLNQRRITRRTAVNFGLGASADEWDGLLTAMARKGYSKAELLAAGLVVQGKGGSVYDKFRKRLIFPVIDVRGDVVAFGGRIVDKNDPGAKYMNSPETIIYSKRRVLYGLNLAKKSKRENIILVEGNIDVVMLHQAGFDNACASMGTALTTEQIRLLSRYTKELILCYDNDNAGRIATQKALELLNDTDFSVRVLELPNRIVDGQPVKQDADDFIKNQGPDAFERLLSGSETGMDFRMARLAAGFDLTSDQGRIDYAAAAADLLAELPNAVEREIYTTRAAASAGISPDAVSYTHLTLPTSVKFTPPAPRRPQASRPTPSSWRCSAASSAAATASGGSRKSATSTSPRRSSRRSAPSATTISAPPWRRRACCGSSARTTACSAMRRRCGRGNFPLPCSDAFSRGCGSSGRSRAAFLSPSSPRALRPTRSATSPPSCRSRSR